MDNSNHDIQNNPFNTPANTDDPSSPPSNLASQSRINNSFQPQPVQPTTNQPSQSIAVATDSTSPSLNPTIASVNHQQTNHNAADNPDQTFNHSASIITQPNTNLSDKQTATDSPIKPKLKKVKLIIVLIMSLCLLAGSGAAAYKFLIIDNRPQNFVERSIKTTLAHKQLIRAKEYIDSTNHKTEGLGMSIKGETTYDPSQARIQQRIDYDISFLGNYAADILVDLKKQDTYFKLDIDKKYLNILEEYASFQTEEPRSIVSLLRDIYSMLNGKWFSVSQQEVKELSHSLSSSETTQKSSQELTNLLNQCQNPKDLTLLKFIEVTKELDKKDKYRRFEANFNRQMLKDSINQHPKSQCIQAYKKFLDQAKSAKSKLPPMIITIDSQTMLLNEIEFKDKRFSIIIEFDYQGINPIELPQNTQSFKDIQKNIENLNKSFQAYQAKKLSETQSN